MSKNSRIESLEDKFEYPYDDLGDTRFEEWVQHQGAIGANKSLGYLEKNFCLLMDYLKLTIVTVPEHRIVKKVGRNKRNG